MMKRRKQYLAWLLVLTMLLSGSMSVAAAEPSAQTPAAAGTEAGVIDDGTGVEQKPEEGVIDDGTGVEQKPEEGIIDDGTGGEQKPEEGIIDGGAGGEQKPEEGIIDDGTGGEQKPEEGVIDDGTGGEQKPEEGVIDDGTGGEQKPDDGIVDEATPGEVTPEEGITGEELPEAELTAGAALPEEDQESVEKLEPAYVLNPIYADEYSVEDLTAAIDQQMSGDSSVGQETDEATYSVTSMTDAGYAVAQEMMERSASCTIVTSSENAYKDIFQTALTDNEATAPNAGDYLRANWYGYRMEGYYLNAQTVSYTFTISYLTDAAQESAVTNMIPSVLSSLNLSGKSDFEKIKAIHDYVCGRIEYTNDETLLCHSTYAALINGKAVCQGYASLFYRLCREAGISTRFITGSGSGGAHAWNIVKLGDYYYNLDTTWDDQGTVRYDYFMKSEGDFDRHVREADSRDGMDYTSAEFYARYPMAPVSYGAADVNADNLDEQFTGIDGTSVSSRAEGKPKVLVFFSTACGNSMATLQSLRDSSWIGSGKADVIAVEVNNHSKEDVAAFKDTYGCDSIPFCYNGSTAAWNYLEKCGNTVESVTLPIIVYIDADNKIKTYTLGRQNADAILGHIDAMQPGNTHTITASAGIGGTISPDGVKYVTPGETVGYTIIADSGYGVVDVKVDGVSIGAKNAYTFTNITASHTIAATFGAVSASNPFTDVPEGKWYTDAVKFVYANGIMSGTSASTFDPNGTTTRSMVVKILYNLSGTPAVSGNNPFSDVPEGKWYTDAVKWAVQTGVTAGKTPTEFAPNQSVTRQEVARFLYTYAQYRGFDTSARNDLSSFTDNDQVSGWARDAMMWANGIEIINGKGGGRLDPRGMATRAEIAVMVRGFIVNYQ